MKGFLIDLDGTLYRGGEPIPYAADFIRLLQRSELPYLLVTNNSSRTPEQVAEHLQKLGIDVPAASVFTSSQAAAQYIGERQTGRRVHMIGEAGLRLALEQAGFELTEETPDYVVQGIDRSFSYAKLAAAVRHLSGGATYVLTNPDHMLPSDGGLMPGAGSLAAAIRTASGGADRDRQAFAGYYGLRYRTAGAASRRCLGHRRQCSDRHPGRRFRGLPNGSRTYGCGHSG